MVSVIIGGRMVSGWPSMLHILPGPANAASSWLTGDALKVGAPRRYNTFTISSWVLSAMIGAFRA